MNNLVEFKIPTAIAYSRGAITELPSIISKYGGRAIIVTNKKLFEHNLLIDKIVRMLEASFINVMVFDDVTEDSNGDIADIIANTARFSGTNTIIGLGGFKVLNVAKAAASVVTNRGEALDYVNGQKLFHNPLHALAIPTILGSLSEISNGFYLFDKYDNIFKETQSPNAYFSNCIIDPDLYEDTPDKYKFATAISVFAYAFDMYMSRSLNIFSEPFINDAMSISIKEMQGIKSGITKENILKFANANMLVSVASCHSRAGIIRNLSLLAQSMLKINSSVFASIILPYVMDYYCNTLPDKVLALGRFFENDYPIKNNEMLEESALEDLAKTNNSSSNEEEISDTEKETVKKVVESVKKTISQKDSIQINNEKDIVKETRKYLKNMQIPTKLSECGISDKQFSHISSIVLKYSGMDEIATNITADAIMSILEQAY